MKIKFSIIFILAQLSFLAYAEKPEMDDYRIQDYPIDFKFRGGEYFIYDCLRKHFACVSKLSFEVCQEDRQSAIDTKKKILPCAPLKKFPSKRECIYNHYKILDKNPVIRFCRPKSN